jgi:deoxyribodipyrimidine photo-lyase
MKLIINLFIYRRDLRVEDNLALNALAKSNPEIPILPIFIFNPVQISPIKNTYYCRNAVQFMIESIKDVRSNTDDTLLCFHGSDISILEKLLKSFSINAIGFNVDYTPFAKKRDEQIRIWCKKREIKLIEEEDYTLFKMGDIMTDGNKPYQVFTPFYRKVMSNIKMIKKPLTESIKFLKTKHPDSIKDINKYIHKGSNQNLAVRGGRNNVLAILEKISKKEFVKYDNLRDYPSKNATTKLSAYLKFGCVSIREVFFVMKNVNGILDGLVRELLWREFFAQTTYHFPKILDGQVGKVNKMLREKPQETKWNHNKEYSKKWQDGKTGYPIVDAGMRQMNASGWMHNRCRMITAMFLTKDLFIDWKLGERYFAQNLVDYDPASNSGGWQGIESQPYFRAFSPMLQAQRFDKDVEFIKKWIPELKNVPAKAILAWETEYVKYPNIKYSGPIVIHKEQIEKLKKST